MKKKNEQHKNTVDFRDDYTRWQTWMKDRYKILITDMLTRQFELFARL